MKKNYSSMKTGMLILGVLLLLVGIFFLISGFSSFSSLFEMNGGPLGSSGNKGFSSIGFLALGGFLIVIGIGLVYLSQFRKVTSYFASEGSSAIETASHAVGKGIGRGFHETGMNITTQKEIIKVKCPHCGYLESEDAEFCSKCGKKL
jgi:hypothetical protein